MILVAFAHVVEDKSGQLQVFFSTVPVCYALIKRFQICDQSMWVFTIFVFAKSSEELFVNFKVNFLLVVHFDQH